MHVLSLLAKALVVARLVLATPLARRWDDFEIKHAWADIPAGWERYADAPPDHILNLTIRLKQDKFDDLIDHLYQVSDPAHTRYGAHLSKADVDALIAPSSETVDLVESWLHHYGINTSAVHRLGAGDRLSLSVPISQAESLLGTKYSVFFNPSSSSYIIRTTSYSLPKVIHSHVNVVAPTTYFGSMKAMKTTSFVNPKVQAISDSDIQEQLKALAKGPQGLATVPTSCERTITPACLQALYNTTGYVTHATDVNAIGVAGYDEEFANDADLQTFFTRFLPSAEGTTFAHVQVNGGANNQSLPGVEANLDIQYAEAITFPTPNIYYSTAGTPPFVPDSETPTNTNEPFLDWIDFILNQTVIPQTISTSYGDDEQTVPFDYAHTVCCYFAQLGVMGSSVIFASGDDGVGGGSCVSNDGTNEVRFQPIFPASCPFVTTVGGTSNINPEVAASFSGGGFSNYFEQPSYQTSAVTAYLETLGTTNKGLFNVSGRAYPDVSAQSENFQIVVGGRTDSVSGTSCSAPTFAGIVSLLNDFRIGCGKTPLGFLNPFLYSCLPTGFNDIVSGSNPGCGTNGFPAGKGWDPVTGVGTPDFGKLQALIAPVP